MLKRDITYENFNGETVTGTFYFHLSQPELVEMQFSKDEGFGEWITKAMKTDDKAELIGIFKKLILGSYGQKTPDGERFVKSDQLREEFSQTAAYNALFMELATTADAAATFVKGVIPASLSGEIEKTLDTPEAMIQRAQAAVNSGLSTLPAPPAR